MQVLPACNPHALKYYDTHYHDSSNIYAHKLMRESVRLLDVSRYKEVPSIEYLKSIEYITALYALSLQMEALTHVGTEGARLAEMWATRISSTW